MEPFVHAWRNHPEWWFSKDPAYDTLIVNSFEHLLDHEWDPNTNPIGCILLWDQLPRHIFRGQDAHHIIEFFLQKACDVVTRHLSIASQLDDIDFMFFWLPFRHCKTYDRALPVMKAVWDRIQRQGPSPWLRKFLRATYANHPTHDQSTLLSRGHGMDFHELSPVLDYDGQCRTGTTLPHLGQWEYVASHSTILVSLSGGVDSMVTLDLVRSRFPRHRVAAVHINYDNRETCAQEEAVVTWWCQQAHIPLYVRRIQEIHRAPCMEHGFRELYETYTKEVRFGTYATVWRILGMQGAPQVLLGHNADDGIENIFQNMTFGCKYDNLMGMNLESMQDNICFHRPLLRVPKQDIIQHAHAQGIPYLYDSTVSWCVRGKIRDHVVPAIRAFNPKTLQGLVDTADVMSELYGILRMSVDEWKRTLTHPRPGVWEKQVHALPTSALFWKDLLLRGWSICPSNRSMTHLLVRLAFFTQTTSPFKQRVVVNKRMTLEYERQHPSFPATLRFYTHAPEKNPFYEEK